MTTLKRTLMTAVLATAALAYTPAVALAHCDGMDGPVVAAAARSLDTGDVRHALVWVLPEHEAEIVAAFEQTRDVRALGGEARALADRWFFETVARLHRAGEGEPYTGLKHAGRDLGPAIPAADRAIVAGSATELEELISDIVRDGIEARLHAALEHRDHAVSDVAEGRAFVRAYVALLHYVEELHAAAAAAAHGH